MIFQAEIPSEDATAHAFTFNADNQFSFQGCSSTCSFGCYGGTDMDKLLPNFRKINICSNAIKIGELRVDDSHLNIQQCYAFWNAVGTCNGSCYVYTQSHISNSH